MRNLKTQNLNLEQMPLDNVSARPRLGKSTGAGNWSSRFLTGIWCLSIWCGSLMLSNADEKQFRPPDDRPAVDVAKAESHGVRLYESRRMRLFTDIDAEIAAALSPLADQIFDAHEKYFGNLPPDREGRDYQVDAFLIKDKDKFQRAGLLPKTLPEQFHGQQIGYRLWMMDQPFDYYRRHMLLHEATHAYMRAIPGLDLSQMFLEGWAEHFGTHRLTADGKLIVGLMPHNRADFRGHDRLLLIRRDVRRRGIPGLRAMNDNWQPEAFRQFNESYAWSWAACLFLDQNPRTRDFFRKTARELSNPIAGQILFEKLKPDWSNIVTEWNLFAAEAWEGFDFERMAIDFRDGKPLRDLESDPTKPHRMEIRADRGWQSTELLVEKGQRYATAARGQFTLSQQPKPWISEAEGISFRYHAGRPLGRLLAAIHVKKSPDDPESMLNVEGFGANYTIQSPRTGTLYLRLNDHPGELADNKGGVTVEFRSLAAP